MQLNVNSESRRIALYFWDISVFVVRNVGR